MLGALPQTPHRDFIPMNPPENASWALRKGDAEGRQPVEQMSLLKQAKERVSPLLCLIWNQNGVEKRGEAPPISQMWNQNGAEKRGEAPLLCDSFAWRSHATLCFSSMRVRKIPSLTCAMVSSFALGHRR